LFRTESLPHTKIRRAGEDSDREQGVDRSPVGRPLLLNGVPRVGNISSGHGRLVDCDGGRETASVNALMAIPSVAGAHGADRVDLTPHLAEQAARDWTVASVGCRTLFSDDCIAAFVRGKADLGPSAALAEQVFVFYSTVSRAHDPDTRRVTRCVTPPRVSLGLGKNFKPPRMHPMPRGIAFQPRNLQGTLAESPRGVGVVRHQRIRVQLPDAHDGVTGSPTHLVKTNLDRQTDVECHFQGNVLSGSLPPNLSMMKVFSPWRRVIKVNGEITQIGQRAIVSCPIPNVRALLCSGYYAFPQYGSCPAGFFHLSYSSCPERVSRGGGSIYLQQR